MDMTELDDEIFRQKKHLSEYYRLRIEPPTLVNYDESERKALGDYFEKRYGKLPTIVVDNNDTRTSEELNAWFLQDLKKFGEEEDEYYKNHPDAWKEHVIEGLDEIDFEEFKYIVNQQFYDKELEEKIQRDSKSSVSNKNTRKNTRSNSKKTLKNKKVLNSNECIIN